MFVSKYALTFSRDHASTYMYKLTTEYVFDRNQSSYIYLAIQSTHLNPTRFYIVVVDVNEILNCSCPDLKNIPKCSGSFFRSGVFSICLFD